MKRTHLLSLLIVLIVGGGEGSGVKVIDDVVPDPMAENPRDEPLFLRGRNEWHRDKSNAFLDGKADLNADHPHVFETFNADFVNLRP